MKKKIYLPIILILILSLGGFFGFKYLYSKSIYDDAVKLRDQNMYDEAVMRFQEIPNFYDSFSQIAQTRSRQVEHNFLNSDFKGAIKYYEENVSLGLDDVTEVYYKSLAEEIIELTTGDMVIERDYNKCVKMLDKIKYSNFVDKDELSKLVEYSFINYRVIYKLYDDNLLFDLIDKIEMLGDYKNSEKLAYDCKLLFFETTSNYNEISYDKKTHKLLSYAKDLAEIKSERNAKAIFQYALLAEINNDRNLSKEIISLIEQDFPWYSRQNVVSEAVHSIFMSSNFLEAIEKVESLKYYGDLPSNYDTSHIKISYLYSILPKTDHNAIYFILELIESDNTWIKEVLRKYDRVFISEAYLPRYVDRNIDREKPFKQKIGIFGESLVKTYEVELEYIFSANNGEKYNVKETVDNNFKNNSIITYSTSFNINEIERESKMSFDSVTINVFVDGEKLYTELKDLKY